MRIIFLGAPGAGKGTQAENISELLNIPNISTGALLRELIADTESSLGETVRSYVSKGNLVPDDLMIAVLKERFKKGDCENGFILDGFPRTVAQAEYLYKSNIDIDLVINIEVPDKEIISRMSGRRLCADCGMSYHTVYKKPSSDGVCNKCGGTLTVRQDDLLEVVESRLEVYHEQTEPLINYYRNHGELITVIGQEEVADTTKLTVEAVQKFKESV